MKLCFVVPRYGVEVIGGAETGARMLGEHLVAERGWEVEVITTCARDHQSWENHYPPGDSLVNGVVLRRFPVLQGRVPEFDRLSRPLVEAPSRVTVEQSKEWVELQGPVCPEVVDAAVESTADVVAFYPYLYHPTVTGVPRLAGRSVVHPAAHDEPLLRFPVFGEVFRNAGGIAFHTFAERDLVNRRFKTAATPQVVAGLGIETGTSDPSGAKEVLGFDGVPYLCCIGRVEGTKGTTELVQFFHRYRERHPDPLKLVLVGRVIETPPYHPDVTVTGTVAEPVKWGILGGAAGLVAPGRYESFSLAVLEAMSLGVPPIVNGRCAATAEHCTRSGVGWTYLGAGDFDRAVTGALNLDPARARAAQDYVERHFRWQPVLERYCRFVHSMAERSAA